MTTKKASPPTAGLRKSSSLKIGRVPETSAQVVPEPDLPRPDPAMIAAEIMLLDAFGELGVELETIRKRGTIVVVQTQSSAWTPFFCAAWKTAVSGDRSHDGRKLPSYFKSNDDVFIFTETDVPRARGLEEAAENFAAVVHRAGGVVGIAAEPDWLPADLIAAADYRIVVGEFKPHQVIQLAKRLTGELPLATITQTEAARLTPRLIRLAARPDGTADGYISKLRRLLTMEASGDNKSDCPGTDRSPRAAPTLERLHGMHEAVSWGMVLREDLAAYRAGKRKWSDLDRALLLSGPPGTGKTTFARALAASCAIPLLAGSYAAWIGTGTGHQGDLIRSMRKAFREAKNAAPSILFLDEVDSFPNRAEVTNYPEWHIEVVNALLAEVDGVEDREGVILVAACNDPRRLDPALTRSGRLERHVRIGLPNRSEFAEILREHLGADLCLEDLAAVTLLATGATGADAERFVRGARRRARVAGREMQLADLIGEIRGQDDRTREELMTVAVHEAGHALAALVLGAPFDGVSLRRGNGSGGRLSLLGANNYVSAGDVHRQLVLLLAGRAAEQVCLQRVTSAAGGGVGSDLEQATRLTAAAAAELGLDDAHGLVWAGLAGQPSDLARALRSDPLLVKLVRERLDRAYADALDLIRQVREEVIAVSAQLVRDIALDSRTLAKLVTSVREEVACSR